MSALAYKARSGGNLLDKKDFIITSPWEMRKLIGWFQNVIEETSDSPPNHYSTGHCLHKDYIDLQSENALIAQIRIFHQTSMQKSPTRFSFLLMCSTARTVTRISFRDPSRSVSINGMWSLVECLTSKTDRVLIIEFHLERTMCGTMLWNRWNDLIWFYGRRVIFMLRAKHIGLRLIPNAPLSAKELHMLAWIAWNHSFLMV